MADRERRELTGLRLAAQALARASFDSPADVVRGMLAMQGQDYAGAKWSVALRTPKSTEADVESALAAGEIARAWPLRGTLHLVAPEDLGWMLPLAAERQESFSVKRRADLGITDDELDRAERIAREVMAGGVSMRRDRLLESWQSAGIPTDGQRGYHLLWNLGHRGVIVFGATEGKQPTFALFEERVPSPRRLDPDEALAELALRYFTSHGPSTVRDLAWWASITLGAARRGLAAVEDRLEAREFGGVPHWFRPGLEPEWRGIHALAGFDEYLLGYQDRSPVLPAEYAQRIVPGNNGIFQPTVVVDGQVVGTWRRTETAKVVRAELIGFEPLTTRARDGFARSMKRYGRYLGKPVEIAE